MPALGLLEGQRLRYRLGDPLVRPEDWTGHGGSGIHDKALYTTDWPKLYLANPADARAQYADALSQAFDPEQWPTLDAFFAAHGGAPVLPPVNVPVHDLVTEAQDVQWALAHHNSTNPADRTRIDAIMTQYSVINTAPFQPDPAPLNPAPVVATPAVSTPAPAAAFQPDPAPLTPAAPVTQTQQDVTWAQANINSTVPGAHDQAVQILHSNGLMTDADYQAYAAQQTADAAALASAPRDPVTGPSFQPDPTPLSPTAVPDGGGRAGDVTAVDTGTVTPNTTGADATTATTSKSLILPLAVAAAAFFFIKG